MKRIANKLLYYVFITCVTGIVIGSLSVIIIDEVTDSKNESIARDKQIADSLDLLEKSKTAWELDSVTILLDLGDPVTYKFKYNTLIDSILYIDTSKYKPSSEALLSTLHAAYWAYDTVITKFIYDTKIILANGITTSKNIYRSDTMFSSSCGQLLTKETSLTKYYECMTPTDIIKSICKKEATTDDSFSFIEYNSCVNTAEVIDTAIDVSATERKKCGTAIINLKYNYSDSTFNLVSTRPNECLDHETSYWYVNNDKKYRW